MRRRDRPVRARTAATLSGTVGGEEVIVQMSRQPNRSRSRRIVLAVALFLGVVVTTGDQDCAQPSTTGVLATLSLLPRLMGALGRGLVLISLPGKEIEGECAPQR